jgi:hypothetical protein
LLDLDTEKIAGTEGKDRMWTLLEMLQKIPTQFMFAPGERIIQENFTWAPKSMMNKEGYTVLLDQMPAVHGAIGLIVRMPGFRLFPRSVPNRDTCLMKSDDGSDLYTIFNLGKDEVGLYGRKLVPGTSRTQLL